MQIKYVFSIIIVLGLFSCSENSEPTIAHHTKTTIEAKNFLQDVLYQEGKILFVMHCKNCHAINAHADPQLLANLHEKWIDKKLLYAFIRNPQAVIAKDAYAKALYEQCNKAEMPPCPLLTNKQIDLILNYVDITLSEKKENK